MSTVDRKVLARATKELSVALLTLAHTKPAIEKAVHDSENTAECVTEIQTFEAVLARVAGAYAAVVEHLKRFAPTGYTPLSNISFELRAADAAVEAALVPYLSVKAIRDHADGWESVTDMLEEAEGEPS